MSSAPVNVWMGGNTKDRYFKSKASKALKAGKKTANKNAKRIDKIEKVVNQIANQPEIKYIALSSSVLSVDHSNPRVQLLNGMIQGNIDGQRIGEIIKMKKITLNYKLYTINNAFTNTVTSSRSVRVMLVLEKNPKGITFSFGDLFGVLTPYTTTIYNYKGVDFKQRYEVLHDRVYNVQTQQGEYVYQIERKLNRNVDYSKGNTGTITDIESGALYFIVISDDNNVNHQNFRYNMLIEYIDN